MRKGLLALATVAVALGTSACYTADLKATTDPNARVICAPIVNGEADYAHAFHTDKASADSQGFENNPNVLCDLEVNQQ